MAQLYTIDKVLKKDAKFGWVERSEEAVDRLIV
jgi:hypothetical protein